MSALLRRTWILAGIGGNILSFGGYHIFFTYLRPFFLELDLAFGSHYAFRDPAGLRSGERPRHLHCGRAPRESLPVNHDSGPSGLHSRRARLASLPRARGHRHRAGCFLGIRVRLYPGRLVHMDRPHPLRQGGACRRAHRRGDAIRHWPCRRRVAFNGDNLGINGIFLAAAGISVMAALLIAVSFSLFARDTGHKALFPFRWPQSASPIWRAERPNRPQ